MSVADELAEMLKEQVEGLLKLYANLNFTYYTLWL